MVSRLETLTITEARRLALARAGLLKPDWTGFPRRGGGGKKRAEETATAVIRRFGYLQLDTVSIAGARSHAIVLQSRLLNSDPSLGEEMLRPGGTVFEYWGHEASWIPLELYPVFEFRRREFRHHPWWGDIIGAHPKTAQNLLDRIRSEGPIRSLDMEGQGSRGWWDLKEARRVASALWSSGELAIRERRNFQRTYDLAERVIPDELRNRPIRKPEGLELLLLKALDGHGWATTGTITATWRLRNRRAEISDTLGRLVEQGRIIPCAVAIPKKRPVTGWVRPEDLELASKLGASRLRSDRGVLLSPFDPILWDRTRVRDLFGFDQVLEIFKPAAQRVYGYYCMPVLAGERLVARLDLKAEKKAARLRVLSCRYEATGSEPCASAVDREAVRTALDRYAGALRLDASMEPGVRVC